VVQSGASASSSSGGVVVTAGAAHGSGGAVRVAAGASSTGRGASTHVTGGAGATRGGDAQLLGGNVLSGEARGGSVRVRGGAGRGGDGGVLITDGSGALRLGVSPRTGVSVASRGSSSLSVFSGSTLALGVGSESEGLVSHGDASVTGQGVMRMRANKLMSHVPLDTVQVISPSDRRIKRDIQDIDQEALMHRLMRLRVRRYKYSDEWREVRGLASDTSVRGVIAQEVREVMPEYVTVTDEMRFDEKGFNMTDFHEVDKVALVIDLLAALQARHRRLSVGANAATASGSVSISTMVATEASTRSGHVSVTSGRATRGGSGSVSLRTGGATSGGGSGDIPICARWLS